MASEALSARLRYMSDAAHLLATIEPTTSAYLMSQCHDVMFDNDLEPTDTHKRQACGACGNIIVPGRSGTIRKEVAGLVGKERPGRSNHRRTDVKHQARAMVYTCASCSRTTRFPLTNSIPTAIRKKSKHDSRSASLQASLTSSALHKTQPSVEVPISTSVNASSKKRAKSRKQGGLQALLAKKNESASTGGFGLDLFDLMKSG
jgi:ribonuclease MRP protein subunit SNM1